MTEDFSAAAFRRSLLAWYGKHKRRLPWRGQYDPYRIWVSEIMLQQTRVAVVKERYPEFLRRFPNLQALARAPREQVLAAWSGLGYYRRALNLHVAAQLVAKRGGALPHTSEELRQLPGIGRYTAAAIASIAFAEPAAVVDGNVERVLERLFVRRGTRDDGRRSRSSSRLDHWKLANELLDGDLPGDFNQAMMELGATICHPLVPDCAACPVARFCSGRSKVQRLRKVGSQKRRRVREKYLLLHRGQAVYLVRRAAGERLMPGMWELPRARARAGGKIVRARHSITNTDFDISAVVSQARVRNLRGGKWTPLTQLHVLPLTGLARKLLRKAFPAAAQYYLK